MRAAVTRAVGTIEVVDVPEPGEPVSIAVRAVRRARIEEGERVVILGAGPIGQSVCLLACERGASVLIVDPQESRLELSSLMGADTLVWRGRDEVVKASREWSGG